MAAAREARDHDRAAATYDAAAEAYAARLSDELEHKPLDRALLTALLDARPAGSRVADLGCGPGHVSGWMAARGASCVGIDVSPRMVELARLAEPAAEFREGDLLSLPAGEAEFGAIVALYSVIHLMRDELAPAFAEMRRVLVPGGQALVSFHVGDEVRHVTDLWGAEVDLDFRFLLPADVSVAMEEAGLAVEARLEREPYPEEVVTRRCYLLGRRPPTGGKEG